MSTFPSREERQKCWGARDTYWECLDKNKITEKGNDGPCAQFRKLYEQSCSSQWVTHFDRKRNYLRFKEKIEKDGIPNKTIDNGSHNKGSFEKRRVYHEISC